jgi:general secretion pathway protein D
MRENSSRFSTRASAIVLALCVTCVGCASTAALRNGRQAEDQQNYDRAVVEYTRAVNLDPDNADARNGLLRSRQRAAQDHFARGRRLSGTGQLEEALIEFQLAAELNPGSPDIERELASTRTQLRTKIAVAREGQTQLEALVERARNLPPPGLQLPPAAPLPDSLTFRDAGSRDVITALARFADINVVFDPAFRPQTISIDLRKMTFDQALSAIAASTQTFFRVTGPRTITVIPDTPAKRREYQEEIVQTFYLSNADLKETMDLLRVVIDARQIAAIAATNAITIHDTPERIAAASKLIASIDKARPEVMIDVELMEVNRTKLREYGLQLASPGAAGVSGTADVNRDKLTLQDLRNLNQSQVYLTAVPGLYYRLLKSDTSTRILANPQLRTSVGLSAQARFGERVPVPVTTFSPLAQGGVAQQPITSFNYENIGVNIDITPRTHLDDEVTLALKVSVTSISGTGFGGLPTFGNREISQVVRLGDGETNMLAGLIRDDERHVLDGIPGLSDLPIIGRLFGRSRTEAQQTDVILTLTPHIVRVLDLTEEDLRPFRLGRDLGTAPAILDLPLPIPSTPPAAIPQAPTPTPPPDGGGEPATPVRPPTAPQKD